MISKYASALVLGTALMSGAAFAQSGMTGTATPSATPSATTSTVQDLKGNWRASKLVGLSVYNDSNDKLGNIDDVLVDKTGKISAIVIGVGGFLGVGERDIAVTFDKLKWVNEPVRSANATAPGANTAPSSTSTNMGATTGSAATNTTAANANTANSRDPWYPDHAVISGTTDQLKALPEFKYSDYR